MSLMLKLLAITLLSSTLAYAGFQNVKVEKFLTKMISTNPGIESINVKVTNSIVIKEKRDWSAYYVKVDAILKKDKRKVSQKMIWFSNGEVITKDLFDLNKGIDLKDSVSLPFKDKYYTKANLIYGNANAEHKVALFSDPLCPFCRNFVPSAIEYMKKQPNKFAIYYFHFPLSGLHPASVELVKAATALEFKGVKDVVLKLYKVKVNAREKSQEKILIEFNKEMHSNITLAEMNSKKVQEHLKRDLKIADDLMVAGTPTMFLDSKLDKKKNKYKMVK